jgi:hypothetical protein
MQIDDTVYDSNNIRYKLIKFKIGKLLTPANRRKMKEIYFNTV